MKRAMTVLALVAVPSNGLAAPTALSPSDGIDAGSKAGLAESVRLIADDRYCEALPLLEELAIAVPDNADVFNLLGYVHRKMDDLDVSAAHYVRALSLDPNHLATLAYQGQLFLQEGDLDKALANLSRLEALCRSCPERMELEAAVSAFPSPNPDTPADRQRREWRPPPRETRVSPQGQSTARRAPPPRFPV